MKMKILLHLLCLTTFLASNVYGQCTQPGQDADAETQRTYAECLQRLMNAQAGATQGGRDPRSAAIRNCMPELSNQNIPTTPAPPTVETILSGEFPNVTPNPVPTNLAPGTPGPPVLTTPGGLLPCRALQIATTSVVASDFADDPEIVPSQDGQIFCRRKTGFTADWESCRSTLKMYDSIVVMEAGLQLIQGVRANNSQQSSNQQISQRAAQGDAQNAALDASIQQNRLASSLNQEQAMAYTAAVAALGAKIASWVKSDVPSLQSKFCGGQQEQPLPNGMTIDENFNLTVPPTVGLSTRTALPVTCQKAIAFARTRYGGDMIANDQAKAAFTTAAMMFAAKGIMAGIKSRQLSNIAKQTEQVKQSTEDPYNPATFEYCQVNSADPRCAGPVTRTSGSGLQDGGFSFGDSFGNNAIGSLGDPDSLGGGDPLALPGGENIADVNNPFVDDAKKASDILDPAGAASLQPGGAGGGGGGGAPGAGGGTASLGNDVPGVDESKKENDIKANKADGKYNLAGGGGFQAIKPMKENNPFANLFDGKAGGGLNEDRSIASGDIDGKDSGLFAKISKRYGQVQADKRIEAKNLEE